MPAKTFPSKERAYVNRWRAAHYKTVKGYALAIVNKYRTRDRRAGRSVCDFDWIWFNENIIMIPCIYCNGVDAPTNRMTADRVDNAQGHTKANVVPACDRCNRVRGDWFTFDEMLYLGNVIREMPRSKRPETPSSRKSPTRS